MDDIFVYYTKLPQGINEFITPCLDGYTLYIDENISDEKRFQAYMHALGHIKNNDFEHYNVQIIEAKAHRRIV